MSEREYRGEQRALHDLGEVRQREDGTVEIREVRPETISFAVGERLRRIEHGTGDGSDGSLDRRASPDADFPTNSWQELRRISVGFPPTVGGFSGSEEEAVGVWDHLDVDEIGRGSGAAVDLEGHAAGRC